MLSYRTEVVVAADRYVCLQLPENFPEGRATVTVQFHEQPTGIVGDMRVDPDPDREDIEWWEEFEDDPETVG